MKNTPRATDVSFRRTLPASFSFFASFERHRISTTQNFQGFSAELYCDIFFAHSQEDVTAPLYEQIGRLQMEVDWLKKSSETLGGGQAQIGSIRNIWRVVGGSASRPGGPGAFQRLLRPDSDRERRESGADAPDRRVVSAASVLRVSADGWMVEGPDMDSEREAGLAADGFDGAASGSAGAAHQPSTPQASRLPVSAPEPCHYGLERGLVREHHLHSAPPWLSLPGRRHEQVQPVRAGLGVDQLDGNGLLPAGLKPRLDARQTWHLEHRPRGTVHERRLHGAAQGGRGTDQHGRAWPCPGQRVHRAAVAFGQVRGGVSAELRQWAGVPPWAGALLPVLQPQAPASDPGQSNAKRNSHGTSGLTRKCTSVAGHGAAPRPQGAGTGTRQGGGQPKEH